MHNEESIAVMIARLWPIIVFFASTIALIASAMGVAIYRIGQNTKAYENIKSALFKKDGTLVNVPAADFKEYAEKVGIRIGEIEKEQFKMDLIKQDVDKVEEQQALNLKKNLTVSEHTALCEVQTYKIKEFLAAEFKTFKKELFDEMRNNK